MYSHFFLDMFKQIINLRELSFLETNQSFYAKLMVMPLVISLSIHSEQKTHTTQQLIEPWARWTITTEV